MEYTLSPLSEHTGAEVRGIDLTELADEVSRARLNRAFVDCSALVFRDEHLMPQELCLIDILASYVSVCGRQ